MNSRNAQLQALTKQLWCMYKVLTCIT